MEKKNGDKSERREPVSDSVSAQTHTAADSARRARDRGGRARAGTQVMGPETMDLVDASSSPFSPNEFNNAVHLHHYVNCTK